MYDGAVTRADVDVWESELEGLLARIRPLFYRTESKKHAGQYFRGLLSSIERKNGWTIAEQVGELEPKALQRFLNLSPWDADALLDLNREYAMEHLADPGGVLVADPTGFAKKGTKSVGVQRQYSGTLGRVDNCQIATFLAYVTPGEIGCCSTAGCMCPRSPGLLTRPAAHRPVSPRRWRFRPGQRRSGR